MLSPTISSGSLGEESASLYTDGGTPLSDSGESSHATAQSIRVSCLDSNARIRKPSPIQQDESSVIGASLDVVDADRISPHPLKKKKKLKRPSRSAFKTLAQVVALEAIQEEISENTVPERMCRTFDQLQLTEVRSVQECNSECKHWTRTHIMPFLIPKPRAWPQLCFV